ncbi:MAG: hypothetical protein AB7I04_24535 [Pseudomonadales bacterium]
MSSRTGGLLRATLLAAAVAAVLLVTVVLPAEYGIDPLGTGERLGLTGLSRAGPSAVSSAASAFRSERIRFELAPFESVEYKYRLERDGGMVFAWTASGEVLFDLHAEPDGAEPGYAESFEQGRDGADNGTYVAPFPGIHGWFWENRGMETVELELRTSGFFEHAIEFRDGDQSQRRVAPAGGLDR